MLLSGGVYVPCIYFLAYQLKVTVDNSGLSCRLLGVNSDSDSCEPVWPSGKALGW